ELRRETGAHVEIFQDTSYRPGNGVDPMRGLTDQLKLDVEQSALLVVLMSEDYLGSEWCADERDWWLQHQLKTKLNPAGRVAIVKIGKTDRTGWPKAFVDDFDKALTGFDFIDHLQPGQRPPPMGWPVPDDRTGVPFRTQMLVLAAWLNT